MKRFPSVNRTRKMNAEEYAGFLRLWITPPSRALRPSAEIEAYLRYVAEQNPLTAPARRALGQDTHRAA